MRKTLALIGLPLLLGGCGLPPALTAASWALDGVSYLVSGKSVTDHAISEVAAQDCALFRIVQGREFCEDYEVDGDHSLTLTASGVASPDNPSDPLFVPPEIAEIAAGFGPGTIEVEQPNTLVAFQPVALRGHEPRAAVPEAPRVDLAASQFVIGSFVDPDNAEGLRERQAVLNAEIRTVQAMGKTWHRVVVAASLEDVHNAGFDDAWRLPDRSGPVLVQVAEVN